MRSRMRPYYRGSDRTKEGNFRRRSWREGPHPRGTADRRPWFDSEPTRHVDPVDGCAPGSMRMQTAREPTFDPREEPGALAAHARICAGGEEQSSSLPRQSMPQYLVADSSWVGRPNI